jgi:hypothetical protein
MKRRRKDATLTPAHHPPKPCAGEGVVEVFSPSPTAEWALPIAFSSTSTIKFNFPTLQAGDDNFATAACVKDHVPGIAFLETTQIIALQVSESNRK